MVVFYFDKRLRMERIIRNKGGWKNMRGIFAKDTFIKFPILSYIGISPKELSIDFL